MRDENGDCDFRLNDITDPTGPRQVSDWGIQDAGGPFTAGQRCDADANCGHGAEPTEDGRKVFLSHCDSGFVKLDSGRNRRLLVVVLGRRARDRHEQSAGAA